MTLKAVIIAVALVLTSVVAGSFVVVRKALSNNPNIWNNISLIAESFEEEDDKKNQQEVPFSKMEGTRKVITLENADSKSYGPNPIEVKIGYTVTWINNDSSRHTVTYNESSSSSSSSTFDSGILREGQSFSFTFEKEGEFPYFCTLHPSMVGKVVVTP